MGREGATVCWAQAAAAQNAHPAANRIVVETFMANPSVASLP